MDKGSVSPGAGAGGAPGLANDEVSPDEAAGVSGAGKSERSGNVAGARVPAAPALAPGSGKLGGAKAPKGGAVLAKCSRSTEAKTERPSATASAMGRRFRRKSLGDE